MSCTPNIAAARRRAVRRRAHDALACLVAFLLAFCLAGATQAAAWADDDVPATAPDAQAGEGGQDGADANGGPAPDPPQGTDAPDPEPEPAAPADAHVEGISLYRETPYVGAGWELAANSWEDTPATGVQLSKKAETLQLRVQLVYDDGSTAWAAERATPVEWSTSDAAVAAVTQTGALVAAADGTCLASAACEGFTVSVPVQVQGQANTRYVSEIVLVNDAGQPFFGGEGVQLDDLNQTARLVARIAVTDPATGEATYYSTADGPLSAQTHGELSDVAWSVNDTNLGYVEPTTGEYRPADWGSVLVTCASRAGLGGQTASGSVWVYAASPHKQDGGRNPQDTLTVRVRYELVPEQVVSEKTFTRAEVEALGCELHSYTCVGRGTFATASARGVPFARVLEAAGANLQGISHFSFVTADSGGAEYGETVSYQMLFGATRYYFPNYAVGGNTSDAVAVPPLLAVESNFRWFDPATGLGEEEDYATMTDDTCFRLLFGSTGSGQTTTSKQIYWINTVNVVLAGGPSTHGGDGAGDGGEGEGSGTGQGNGGGATAGGQAPADGGQPTGISPATPLATDAAEGMPDAQGAQDAREDGGAEPAWSVYQIMNPYESAVAAPDFENPWAPFAAPLAAGCAAAGAAWAALRFKSQKRAIAW